MSNEVSTVSNPFASSQVAARSNNNAIADGEQQRAIAEVQAAVLMAKKFPRDQIAAMDRILQSCTRQTLAEQAIYQYARGGTNISGPSIRLAECLAQGWGNISFGLRELEQRNGESTMQAFAWDIETNSRREMTFQVPHVRHTRQGQKRLTDPRDIYEMVANQGARRLRACILSVIPGDVVEAAVNQCEATMHTKVAVTPELIKTLQEKFAEYGVSKAMLEERIQRRIDAITPALVVQLRKIFNSLKDGMSQPGDWFNAVGEPEKKKGEESLKEKLASKKEKESEPKPEPEEVNEPQNTEPEAVEVEKKEDNINLADMPHETQTQGRAKAKEFIKQIEAGAEKVDLLQQCGEGFIESLSKNGLGLLKSKIEKA